MKKVLVVMLVSVMLFMLGGCDSAPISSSRQDTNKTLAIGNTLSENQPTPQTLSVHQSVII